MTHREFAQQISYIVRQAAGWASDMLSPIDMNMTVSQETVTRFTKAMRERLDLIEEMAGISEEREA